MGTQFRNLKICVGAQFHPKMQHLIPRLLLLVLALGAGQSAAQPRAIHPTNAFGHLQPVFQENKGQWGSEVKFLYRSGGMDLWITDHGVIYDLHDEEIADTCGEPIPFEVRMDPRQRHEVQNLMIKRTGHVVRMDYIKTASTPTVIGTDQQIGIYNYFLGNDSTKWVTNVHTYTGVTIQNLYAGVDAVFYIDNGMPRYDLRLKPGADLSSIRINFTGQDLLSLDTPGNLVMKTTMGDIEQSQLLAYQVRDGIKEQVACRFKIGDGGAVVFDVGKYDVLAELVLDPLVYSTYVGGNSSADIANAVAIDSGGCAYIVGFTYSKGIYPLGFPTTQGAYQAINIGSPEAFVSKLNQGGSGLIYSTYLGDSDFNEATAVAVDTSGEAFVAGRVGWNGIYSSDFPITAGAIQKTFGGGVFDAFVTKLNSTGSVLLYSTYLGGEGTDEAHAIAVNRVGEAFVAGATGSRFGFPTTSDAFQSQNKSIRGGWTAFVSKLNLSGSGLIYSTLLGGARSDNAYGIAIDDSENAYIAGATTSDGSQTTAFPTTPGAYQVVAGGNGDAFVTKLNPLGSALLYSTYLGGAQEDVAYSIAIDGVGCAYVVGFTTSYGGNGSGFPTSPGAFQTINNSGKYSYDAFVTKLNSTGTDLEYSTYLGGSNYDQATGIVVNPAGQAIVIGYTQSNGVYPLGFPTTATAFQTQNNGLNDGFITIVSARGDSLLYSTYFGGSDDELALGIVTDRAGSIYVAGTSESTGLFPMGFPTTKGAFRTANPQDSTGQNVEDAFVLKFAVSQTLASLNLEQTTSLCGTTSILCAITNGGAGTMTLDSGIATKPFSVLSTQFPIPLPGNSAVQVIVQFLPQTTGVFSNAFKLFYRTPDGASHDTTMILSATSSRPPMIGVVLDPHQFASPVSGTVDIPLYLSGTLDETTSQTIGVQNLVTTLAMNTDLLTPIDVVSEIPSIANISYQYKGNLVTIQVPLPANFTFTDSTKLLTLRLKAFLSDTMQTAVTLTSAVFSLTDTLPCFSQSGGSGSCTFALIADCGDSIISHELAQGPDFAIQSIIPNPTQGKLSVALSNRREEDVLYEVFDELGKTIQQGKMSGGMNAIHLASSKSGSYYLRLTSRGRVESRRIVLQR